MLGLGQAQWRASRGHDYTVAEGRGKVARSKSWAVHYYGPQPGDRELIGFARTGPEAAELAMEDWESRGAPTQRMRANHMRYRMNARTRHPRLRSTIDSRAVEEDVRELVEYWRSTGRLYIEDPDVFYEHGQWFVQAWDPIEEHQRSWSVVDTSSGLNLEEV
jgi:hypothetical protein